MKSPWEIFNRIYRNWSILDASQSSDLPENFYGFSNFHYQIHMFNNSQAEQLIGSHLKSMEH